ncbi:MAG: chorismate mutase [Acidobacteria bacterium]|nr:MAG: chorismate mutase [Acidobacteriota bacterium]
MTEALKQRRTEIDELNLELLQLINRRAQVVADIARLKRESKLPVSDEAREAAIFNTLLNENSGPLNAASIKRIFGSIIAESRRLQYRLGVESTCTK